MKMNRNRKKSKIFSTVEKSGCDDLGRSDSSSSAHHSVDNDEDSNVDVDRKDSFISIRRISILSTLKDRFFNMISSQRSGCDLEVDCPPVPYLGKNVEIDQMILRNRTSRENCESVIEAVLGSVSESVNDVMSIVVVDHQEALLIVSVVSKTISTDGRNIIGMNEFNAKCSADTQSLLKLKKSMTDGMRNNSSAIFVED